MKDPIICGIINVTYDSFSGDGLIQRGQNTEDKVKYLALKKCENMIKQGVKIIDLGGESSRPFSTPIKGVEEAKNVIPILKAIRNEFKKVFISIDTYKYLVAKKAVDEGVDIINDITAFRGDKRMLNLVKKNDLGCVLMHMKGIPHTMQEKVIYKDTVAEIIEFFNERLNFCFKKGIKKEHVLIDPGIGFGKRQEDNLRIMKELYKLKVFGLPIFLGVSRKSFIGNILNNKVEDRLIGTMAANVISLIKGANILRVHDVKETMQVIKISSAIMNN
ncbi:MAG: dihydropteroate synthase [Candidatus Omnitrophica bacterium]|nr:dihydropteroate synthase [Candidatus Omnitrophota bacterium]